MSNPSQDAAESRLASVVDPDGRGPELLGWGHSLLCAQPRRFTAQAALDGLAEASLGPVLVVLASRPDQARHILAAIGGRDPTPALVPVALSPAAAEVFAAAGLEAVPPARALDALVSALELDAPPTTGGDPPLPGAGPATDPTRLEEAIASLFVVFQPLRRPASRLAIAHEVLVRSRTPGLAQPRALLAAAAAADRLADIDDRVRELVRRHLDTGDVPGTVFVNLDAQELLRGVVAGPQDPLRLHAPQVVLEFRGMPPDTYDRGGYRTLDRALAAGYRVSIGDLGLRTDDLVRMRGLRPAFYKATLPAECPPQAVGELHLLRELSLQDGAELVLLGLQSADHLRVAQAVGCDLVQGFLVGRPAGNPV